MHVQRRQAQNRLKEIPLDRDDIKKFLVRLQEIKNDFDEFQDHWDRGKIKRQTRFYSAMNSYETQCSADIKSILRRMERKLGVFTLDRLNPFNGIIAAIDR